MTFRRSSDGIILQMMSLFYKMGLICLMASGNREDLGNYQARILSIWRPLRRMENYFIKSRY